MYVFIFFLLFRVIYNLGNTGHTLKFEVEDGVEPKEFNLVATQYTTETMELPTGK
jgi:hypothetical protein